MSDDYVRATHSEESLKAKPARAPFGYYGAKQKLARRIVGELPPHNAWVEAFCGSAALTLAKEPAPIEVINDQDGEIVNVFRQLRDNHEELCRLISLTPYAMGELEAAREPDATTDALERARRFLVLAMMTVNGTSKSARHRRAGFSFSQSYARGGREARVNRWYNLPERLASVVERLRGVRIEHRDALELVDMFSDRPATLMYLDPPYFTKREHSYEVDANSLDFHEKLLAKCRGAKCMILVSGYDCELYNELLVGRGGWAREEILCSTRDTTGRDYPRSEVLWKNLPFQKALRSGRIPIRLSKKESSERKLNPPRK